MTSAHPVTELIPYLRDELTAAERERVTLHLGECVSCRETLAGFRGVLEGLRSSVAEPPEIDWLRYRAELRAKLEERASRRRTWAFELPRLVPLAATAALGVLALVFTLRGHVLTKPPGEDLALFEQTAIGSHLELLQNYALVEQIDLLEDLDVVQDLDDSAASSEG